MALGAQSAQVVRLIMRSGLKLVAIGLAARTCRGGRRRTRDPDAAVRRPPARAARLCRSRRDLRRRGCARVPRAVAARLEDRSQPGAPGRLSRLVSSGFFHNSAKPGAYGPRRNLHGSQDAYRRHAGTSRQSRTVVDRRQQGHLGFVRVRGDARPARLVGSDRGRRPARLHGDGAGSRRERSRARPRIEIVGSSPNGCSRMSTSDHAFLEHAPLERVRRSGVARPAPRYSARSAVIGSTRSARSVGIRLPTTVMSDREADGGTQRERIGGLHAGEQRLHAAPGGVGQRHAGDHARQRQHQRCAASPSTGCRRLRAERPPHADLLRPLRHGERQQAVDADAGQHERDHRKRAEHAHLRRRATPCRARRPPPAWSTSVTGSVGSICRMIARIGAATAFRRATTCARRARAGCSR